MATVAIYQRCQYGDSKLPRVSSMKKNKCLFKIFIIISKRRSKGNYITTMECINSLKCLYKTIEKSPSQCCIHVLISSYHHHTSHVQMFACKKYWRRIACLADPDDSDIRLFQKKIRHSSHLLRASMEKLNSKRVELKVVGYPEK